MIAARNDSRNWRGHFREKQQLPQRTHENAQRVQSNDLTKPTRPYQRLRDKKTVDVQHALMTWALALGRS